MSGKYERKKEKKQKMGFLKRPWAALILALLVLAVSVALAMRRTDAVPEPGKIQQTEGAEINATAGVPEGKTSFILNDALQITKLGSYTGAYMEDGSDEILSGVAMIIAENTGDQTLQYAEITLSGSVGDALFKLSTLKPGEKAVVLEANRKAYHAQDVYTEAAASNVVYFTEPVSLMEDQFEIQPLDGGFNITNISGEDITGRITVYFKDFADGMYYGGITYRGHIDGGLKKDEVRQIMSANFSASGTAVVFVTVTQ